MSSMDNSNNYAHFFDNVKSPAELLLKFEVDNLLQGHILS